MAAMQVSIVTPEEEAWRGEADLVIARSPEGEFGIMRGHIPFLAALVPGPITVVSNGNREVFFVSGGFLEASGKVDDYHVIVLADDAEMTGEMEASEIQRRIDEAKTAREQDDADDEAEARMRVAMAGPELGRG